MATDPEPRRAADADQPPRTADIVQQQYERYRYPRPIEDLVAWNRDNWQWYDPQYAQPVLWPDRVARTQLDILVAGCGTNQGAVLAFNNPASRVFAVDVSAASLAHERYLKHKYRLGNLELQQRPIEDLPALGRDFDLIVSTGVLHHLVDPAAGLRALARCLRPDGAMGLMLYAKYGRIGVEWLQALFRELDLKQDEASIQIVRETLTLLPQGHPARVYLKMEPDLASDAVLVDTFLHGRERSYSAQECVSLVQSAGLAFQGWFFNAPYHPHDLARAVMRRIDKLPTRAKWSAMERVYNTNGCHFFMACRRARDPATYVTDFESPACLDDVPALRMRCGLDGRRLLRPGWSMALSEADLPYVQAIDGHRSLREIADRHAGPNAQESARARVRRLFRSLWQLDFIALARAPGTAVDPNVRVALAARDVPRSAVGAAAETAREPGLAVRFVDSWQALTATDAAAVRAFWRREDAGLDAAEMTRRLSEVLVQAVTDEGELAAISTAVPWISPQLLQPLYYYRCFIGARWRGTKLLRTLLRHSVHLLQGWARGHEFPCIGVLLELENPGFARALRQACWHLPPDIEFTYVGRSARGQDLRVWYFPGAKLKTLPNAG